MEGGNSKEYDDLHTFLYYDDRIVTFEGMEFPACSLIASVVSQLPINQINAIAKMNNTEDLFGINYGNYIPLTFLIGGSGDFDSILLSINGISIPKYIIPELLTGSGFSAEIDKIHIFNFLDDIVGAGTVEILKSIPNTTREEFFDLLK